MAVKAESLECSRDRDSSLENFQTVLSRRDLVAQILQTSPAPVYTVAM